MDQYFVTLDQPVITAYPYKFLGRLVVDVYNPDRDYEPENPSEALSGLWDDLSADQQPLTLDTGQPHPISTVFTSFLRLNSQLYSKGDLKAVLLKDHHEGFQAILQRVENRESVGRLLDGNRNKLSMIVGLLITTGVRTGQGRSNDTIHAIAYRVVRKTTAAGYDNSMSWIDIEENQVRIGSKRFDWQNVAMGDNSVAEVPIEVDYEEEDTEIEKQDGKQMESTAQGGKYVIYLTGECPASIPIKVQPVLVVIGHICTTPWHCLSAAIQNILAVEDECERRVLLSRWVQNKKTEHEYVGFVAAIVASTVTGSLQWPQLSRAHWFVFALFYGSLVLGLVSVVIAFHLSILTAAYDTHSSSRNSLFDVLRKTEDGRWGHKGITLFVLQAPVMLLSYSVLSYLAGLALLVLSPLYEVDGVQDGKKIAVIFVVYIIFATLIYLTISLSVYNIFLRAKGESRNDHNVVRGEQRCP